MRLLNSLTLFIVCSCASKIPLDIPVGRIEEESRVEWVNRDKTYNSWILQDCEEKKCVVLKLEDFGQLLNECKIRQ